MSIKQRLMAFKVFFIVLQLDKFAESNSQINSRSKSSSEPVISSKHPKNQWARPDLNRRPPPCQRSFLELEPLLSFSTADCKAVKETKTGDERVPEGGLLSLELQYSHDELLSYTEYRKTELTRKSADWINRASNAFWLSTAGRISAKTINDLRKKTLAKYECESSKSKVLTFAVGFLKYLAKIHLDLRYRSFELFLERPRRIKVRKNVTSRIVTKEDIEYVLDHIHHAESSGSISRARAEQYTAFTVFGALTGQRSMATMMKLTVSQLHEALRAKKPVLRVEAHQDKIRMSHYVPLSRQVIEAIQPLLDRRQDDELIFKHGSFWMWVNGRKSLCRSSKGTSCSAIFASFASSMATLSAGINQIVPIL